MKGHLAKKGNRYYAVIYEGVDPATGKERHRWHAAGETRRGAERVLAELVKRVHDGAYRPPDRISLVDYLQKRWLPVKSTRVRRLTAVLYERCIRLYIAPHIGRIPLQRLRADDLDGLDATLLTSGQRDGTGLSASSVRLVHATLHSALHDAFRKGTIEVMSPTRRSAGDPPRWPERAGLGPRGTATIPHRVDDDLHVRSSFRGHRDAPRRLAGCAGAMSTRRGARDREPSDRWHRRRARGL